jgi:anti-sigma B factor antagonist
MSFTFNLKQKSPVLVIALYGELVDRDECRELTQLLQAACDDGPANIIFDLSDLRIMNSTGLNVLIHSLTMARKSGGEALICGVSKKINELFIITKLNTIFQVLDTEADALAALGNPKDETGSVKTYKTPSSDDQQAWE